LYRRINQDHVEARSSLFVPPGAQKTAGRVEALPA
jgi:hypothetical protein